MSDSGLINTMPPQIYDPYKEQMKKAQMLEEQPAPKKSAWQNFKTKISNMTRCSSKKEKPKMNDQIQKTEVRQKVYAGWEPGKLRGETKTQLPY